MGNRYRCEAVAWSVPVFGGIVGSYAMLNLLNRRLEYDTLGSEGRKEGRGFEESSVQVKAGPSNEYFSYCWV